MKAKRILASVLSVALLLQLSPLGVLALDESLPQTPQVSTVQENLDPVPTAEPAPTEEPAPTAEPIPEETAVPMAAPTPEPTAEPTAIPAEESAPDAAEKPAPEPSAEPTAAPDPAAAVQAMIDALPDEVTDDNAEAVEQALTDIDDAKQSLTDDELAGLDLTRYDAAANALLALWGEAPADAVETLDNYATPTPGSDGYYSIADADDLDWFASQVNYGNNTIKAKLTADITINSKVLNEDGSLISDTGSLQTWTPIGTDSTPFKGEFDGGGYTIRGLYFNNSSESYVGLFGYVGKGGTVKNVNVTDSYVSGKWDVGGICGRNDGGTVQGCTSGCTVTGTSSIGGICGSNEISSNTKGSVLNCHNTGKVTGTEYWIGGVCGYNENSILQENYNTGKVTGNSEVGGVCGENYSGTVNGCYNTGVVSSENNAGGVCGCNISGAVQESYNIGEVSGNYNFVGGVCGQNQGTVKGCYNTGKVSGESQFGGVCGGGRSSTGCYYLDTSGTDSKGGISKTAAEFESGEVAYLLQKALDDAATQSAPATQVWGQKLGADAYPKLSSDDRVYQTTPCTGGYSNNDNQPLDHHYENGVCSNCGEPVSAEQNSDGYYEIYDQWQLRWFADKVNSGETDIKAKLMDDIKLNGDNKVLNDDGSLISDTSNLKSWTPIGKNGNSFKGEFDGNSHTIRGLYFNDTNTGYVGLFGFVGKGGTVKNVTLADSYVSGSWYVGGICGLNNGDTVEGCRNTGNVYGTRQFIGGVCGYNEGTLQKSCNTGIVYGYQNVGGMCGYNKGTLQECYNTDTVEGTMCVGGVCGQNAESTLQECYNTGTVSGTTKVGGMCGLNDYGGTLQECYNTGTVTGKGVDYNCIGGVCGENRNGTVNNCYYLDTSATDSYGGISKTAAEFKSGEVAYLLQQALNDAAEAAGTPVTQVWGQTLTGATKQNYPVLNGAPVYQGTPCQGRYSNKPNDTLNHNYESGKCIYCGQPEIAYTVTIPATVELGNAANATATISAENVTLPTNKTLKVTVNGPFTATLVGTTDVTAQYTI